MQEYDEERLEQQKTYRRRVRTFTAIFGVLLIMGSLLHLAGGGAALLAIWLILLVSVGGIALLFATRFWHWQQMLAPLASEKMKSDPRPPILYLRSFGMDPKSYWYEGRMARALSGLGPVIAIGRPKEKFPATPYIARAYAKDDQWRDRVIDFIGRAQLIVIQVGTSIGLRWELTQVIHLVRPDQLIVCLGPHKISQLAGKDPASEYGRFREQFGGLFPKSLPAEISGSVFIAFGSDWTPIPSLELNRNGNARHPSAQQLQPLQQL